MELEYRKWVLNLWFVYRHWLAFLLMSLDCSERLIQMDVVGLASFVPRFLS